MLSISGSAVERLVAVVAPHTIGRRLLLASLLPALQACAAPLAKLTTPSTTGEAQALLADSAAAHGVAAFSAMRDINVSYAGQWRPLVGRLVPVLVDSGFRGGSQERLLLHERLIAQRHTGPSGRKHVVRRSAANAEGEVRVWFNGEESHDASRLAASALVADGYRLFLLGPMLLAREWGTDHTLIMQRVSSERLVQDGLEYECDVLRVRMTPGLGFSQTDELALFIDRRERLMRRVRFTLNGLDATQGAVADVDTLDHTTQHGVLWPTRFHEQLLRPLPLPVHDWHLTGLDVDRGLDPADVSGIEFTGKATRPAKSLF